MSGGGTRSGRRNNVGSKANTAPASGEYKEFNNVPLSGYSYLGDGSETVKWFEENSNFKEILEKTTVPEKTALKLFSSGQFMNGQQYEGFSKMIRLDRDCTLTYDKLLDQSVMNANVKVVRLATPELLLGKGKIKAALTDLQAMKGKVITSKANLSCAAAKEGLTIGDRTKQVEYKIYIPKGSKGAGMYTGVDDIHNWGVKQREFMLNRDTRWRVGDTKWNNKRKIFETDLFFEDLLPHDYS